MKIKKLVSCLIAGAMLVSATVSFAAAPSNYDGKAYATLGYESSDPDGEFNLAVIANGKVDIVGDAMYIKGSVYSNDTIYVGDGAGNKVDGLFISGVKGMTDYTTGGDLPDQFRVGYIHVNDNHEEDVTNAYSTTLDYEGAVLDKETSFECAYEGFTAPEIANNLGDVTMNVYAQGSWAWDAARGSYQLPAEDGPKTITEDTYIENLSMNGSWVDAYHEGMVVDTTDGDVTVVINNLVDPVNPSITVVGEHEAYIYINNVNNVKDMRINYDLNTENWQYEKNGSVEHTHLYLNGENVSFGASKVAVADMKVTADTLTVAGSSVLSGNIDSNASQFTLTGGMTEITGIVCVPNADSQVVDNGTLYGQLHTNTLTINGAASIIWKADTAVKTAEKEPDPTPTPTPAPVPEGDEIDLKGVGYAYIFGYEPKVSYEYDEATGSGHLVAEIEMAPEDAVTREQVAAMIMRLIDQKYDTKNAEYALTDNMKQHDGTWYARGLAYLASKGTFDGEASVDTGAVTRGEVAKLVAYGLNLTDTTETAFEDISNNPYKSYIETMVAYGYMQGMTDTEFNPDKVMTRAEFCSMFNHIIGREDALLTGADGTEVTPQLYSIVDLDGHWAKDVMLRATSAYDDNGYVDIETRLANIRNELDKYDAQKWF